MANITTILGTDSVSSSRIVLNNNFAALNQELADITGLLDTTEKTLGLTGSITGGSLQVINSNVEAFRANSTSLISNVPATFNQDLVIGNKLILSSSGPNVATIPAANAYEFTTYILDASELAGVNTLPAAEHGQEITILADGSGIIIDNSNLFGADDNVVMGNGGTLTLRYNEDLPAFVIISAFKCTVDDTAI